MRDNKERQKKLDTMFKNCEKKIKDYINSLGPYTVVIDQTNNPLNYYSKYWLRIKEGGWEWGREDGDGIEWEVITEELYKHILHLYNKHFKNSAV